MALLAEELVEEWLNRQGYFTIRGIKLGVHEMDLLAVRPTAGTALECRHLEVQASVRPVSYISDVPRDIQRKEGRKPKSTKERSEAELRVGIREWIAKKFDEPDKVGMRRKLVPTATLWTRELVLNAVKYEREVELFREAGVSIIRLPDVFRELQGNGLLISGAAGAALTDLVALGKSSASQCT